MIGLLWPGSGRHVRIEKTAYAGLWLLRATVPTGRRQRRGLDRACRTLARAGVRRVLTHRWLEGAELSRGLVRLDPGPLYRHMAPELVLAHLARRGVRPERALVELRGEQPGPELCRAAVQLCPRVGQVRVEAGPGSGGVQGRLFRTFGMAADPGAPATLTVRFDGPDGGEDLFLSGPSPRTGGLTLTWPGGGEGTGEMDGERLLCALWQAGLVREHNILMVWVECS